MKKFFVFTMIIAAMGFASCGTSKQTAQNPMTAAVAAQSTNPFGQTYDAPLTGYNTNDESFGAIGIAYASRTRIAELQSIAMTNAQNLIRQQMAHAYRGAIDDYMNMVGNNAGTDIESKIERGGTQIINTMVNDVKNSSDPKFSGVDEKGNMTCYIGIRISKKEFADKVADYVSDDEELKIRFKEDQFRKRMEESFKSFKENK